MPAAAAPRGPRSVSSDPRREFERDESGDQDGRVELPDERLERRDRTRPRSDRDDVAVAERGQGHQAEVDEVGPSDSARDGEGECRVVSRPDGIEERSRDERRDQVDGDRPLDPEPGKATSINELYTR